MISFYVVRIQQHPISVTEFICFLHSLGGLMDLMATLILAVVISVVLLGAWDFRHFLSRYKMFMFWTPS